MNTLTHILNDLSDLFYPQLCITCNERLISQEKYICMKCWFDLPVSNFHTDEENKVAQLFWGRVHVEQATSFFHYRKGSRYQKLIHFIKYKGMKELGQETGKKFGDILAEDGNFNRVNVIVPVPLHPKKQKKRGFNQSEWIARGIAEVMHKPISADNLFRKVFTATQTRKNRFERWQNVDGIFGVKKTELFENQHILLIDDVVTTGSTLEACAFELLKIKATKVSIATLAFADF
ncbi:comF family protein [Mariniphaga anaerophila]|uniref:ComF family protein n=1 Tax=Mariniphaga anaerophila TaxID=1484053 RepID=A0A1M4YWD0_9BACT|nr:phosphoribosyltransferase family protein [Mariniphaga anaerophila]SHF10103.1 comF family protein [Mariniphaga anaerophila]